MMSKLVKKTVEEWLNGIDYGEDPTYIPSDFALKFVTFIKLVNGGEGEENKTPVVHYKMLDNIYGKKTNITNLCARGFAKTTLMGEYLILYIALYGGIDGFGTIPIGLYVSDSIENGVKNMRKNLEYRWENSAFLQKYIPTTRFTDVRWEFTNIDGITTIFKGYGAKTGVRGAKEMGQRPYLAILDDLISDEDARSETVRKSVEDTVYKAIDYALHPSRRKVIWSGTPFNASDPLYKAVESGGWYVNVFPVCEQFPVSREDFKGGWEDRFTYDFVKQQYDKAIATGQVAGFNQELMLRIMSDEDRLIDESDLVFYDRSIVLTNKERYNFYITTDFATSEKKAADFSVISVWAYNNNGDWIWVDGICKRQDMKKNVDDLFRLVTIYKPLQTGIEITGQQKGFVSWIQSEMVTRNIFFQLAQEGSSVGIRPNTNKLVRFNTVVPLFKQHKIWFPSNMEDNECIAEALNELRNVSMSGFKSKHDDFADTISMLSSLQPWKPSEDTGYAYNNGHWDEFPENEINSRNSLIF
jgi:predicted phage terminase large subunit-like protein